MPYIHINRRDVNGMPLEKGGVTLLIRQRNPDGRVLVAMAQCRVDQWFDKRRGRIVAAKRLASNRYRVMGLDDLARLIEELGGDAGRAGGVGRSDRGIAAGRFSANVDPGALVSTRAVGRLD